MTAALRFLICTALAVFVPALFPVEVHAQRVALLHADTAARADVVKARLNTAGLADVTVIDVGDGSGAGTTPSLADLQQFHAVLTWSNFGYLNRDQLGDTLADYVDEGGGVVQASFSFDMSTASLGGRWAAEEYSVFTLATAEPGFGLALVPALSHPILNGTAFDAGAVNFFSPSFLQGGSEAIAHWNNGYPAVATRPGPIGGTIVGLNLFPTMGDAGQLMARSLQFAAADFISAPDGPAVALLAPGGAAAGVGDVRSKLRRLGVFSRVDVIDVSTPAVPSLAMLLQYDAVLTWSSASYGNPAGLGDVLADYVDQNRGVVQSVFSYDATPGQHLEGRWKQEGYRPLTEGAAAAPSFAPLTLLPVLPAHAVLSGVVSFNGGANSHHHMAELDAATTLVATWSDGQPLVAFGLKPSGGRVVALNMYPVSSDAGTGLWDATTDGATLMGNALVFAANHFPSADAGADQIGAATSAAGVTFTLNATGADLDGDGLSFDWSGAVTATGESIVVDVPPPPAPHRSHTVTLTLTVADGKGGETRDSVNLTVTDLVGPVLDGVPSDIAVEAASDSGATVDFGPIAAMDAVDGSVPVSCSHSGEFPIGHTLVTCSATDSRGNTTSDSFTVTVTRADEESDPGVPGRVYGHGFVREGNWYYEFGFSAMENTAGVERGQLRLTVKSGGRAASRRPRRPGSFVSTRATSVTFGADSTVVLRGTGRWNGKDGYVYEVAAADKRIKRRSYDIVRITITSPTGEVVVQCEDKLDGGNIRIFHRNY